MAKTDIQPKIRVPKSVKSGEVFEVKSIITHVMETGLRKDKETGATIPRDIIHTMRVEYGGRDVLRAKWATAVSANPYTSFYVVADKSGPMKFSWTDDAGETYTKDIDIRVEG